MSENCYVTTVIVTYWVFNCRTLVSNPWNENVPAQNMALKLLMKRRNWVTPVS